MLACAFALVHVAAWQTARPLAAAPVGVRLLRDDALDGDAVRRAARALQLPRVRARRRERETATARLRAEIAEAELTSSSLRFDPENVLARLDVLADIVMRDASTAERALTQLANRLRETLDTANEGPRTLEAYAAQATTR